jgi:hypothetical protein
MARATRGLRTSSDIRLLAQDATTSPSSSRTGTWFTPAVIMAMLASGASTGADKNGTTRSPVAGAWRERPDDHLVAQVDVGHDA